MKARCVNTSKRSTVAAHKPRSVSQRRAMLKKYGRGAFLFPDGTPSSRGVPAFPIVSRKTGCYHCGLMRAAYTRIGSAMSRTHSREYKKQLRAARGRLIRLALQFSAPSGKGNACNFAISASDTEGRKDDIRTEPGRHI